MIWMPCTYVCGSSLWSSTCWKPSNVHDTSRWMSTLRLNYHNACIMLLLIWVDFCQSLCSFIFSHVANTAMVSYSVFWRLKRSTAYVSKWSIMTSVPLDRTASTSSFCFIATCLRSNQYFISVRVVVWVGGMASSSVPTVHEYLREDSYGNSNKITHDNNDTTY